MQADGFQGTPSSLLIDRDGSIRHHGFGQEDDIAMDLRVGLSLTTAHIAESEASPRQATDNCDADGRRV